MYSTIVSNEGKVKNLQTKDDDISKSMYLLHNVQLIIHIFAKASITINAFICQCMFILIN
jgi:hypothetical protein